MSNEETRKIADGTNKAYASIDVAMFDPLMSNEVSLERIAYALAGIVFPPWFYEIFGTDISAAASAVGFTEDRYIAKGRDARDPMRVFRNALEQIWNENEVKSDEVPPSNNDGGVATNTNDPFYRTLKLRNWKSMEGTSADDQSSSEDIAKHIVDSVFKDLKTLAYRRLPRYLARNIAASLEDLIKKSKTSPGGGPASLVQATIDEQVGAWNAPPLDDAHKNFAHADALLNHLLTETKKRFSADTTEFTNLTDDVIKAAVRFAWARLNLTGHWDSLPQKEIFCKRFAQFRTVTALGMMHKYRQHFFYGPLLRGKCNEIRSVGPYETLEIITVRTKTESIEESVVSELEITQTKETDTKDSLDLSERVANTVARTATTNISANGSYNALVWNASGSASQSVTESTSNSSERISRKLNEITAKQAETIRKKTTVSTRTVKTSTESITSRHAFENKTKNPVVCGLFSVGHKIESRIQTLGAQLAWQTKVDHPGRSLATSYLQDKAFIDTLFGFERVKRIVTVTSTLRSIPAELYVADAILAVFEETVPQNPALRASEHFRLAKEAIHNFIAKKPSEFKPPIDATYKPGIYSKRADATPDNTQRAAITAEYASHRHLCNEPGGGHGYILDETSLAIVPTNSPPPQAGQATPKHLTVDEGGVIRGITLKHLSEPHPNWFTLQFILDFEVPLVVVAGEKTDPDDPQGDHLRRTKELAALETKLTKKLGRTRANLLFEERKTLLANKIRTLLSGIPGITSNSVAMQILYLRINEIFEIGEMFYDVNTFEYEEAVRLAQSSDVARENYPIHSNIENGDLIPTGSSLGWKHQIDGDYQRDLFLNAPFAWVCLPVKPGKEKAAIEFMTDYGLIVGQPEPVDEMVLELSALREFERLFPQPPNVKECNGVSSIKNSTLIKDFLIWWRSENHTPATDSSSSEGRDHKRSVWDSLCSSLSSLFSEKPKPIKIERPNYDKKTPYENLAKAVEAFCKLKKVSAADVYPITSISDSFVTIEGAAIEKISLQ